MHAENEQRFRQFEAEHPNWRTKRQEAIERVRASFAAEGRSLDDEVDWLLEQLPKWRHRDCQQ